MGHLYINGEWQIGEGSEFSSIAPATGAFLWQGFNASVAQVQSSIQAAKRAFFQWSTWDNIRRVEAVEAFRGVLESRRTEFAAVISAETGKPRWEADTEVGAMINKVAISVKAQQERTGARRGEGFGLEHRPHGVMGVFGPYNFPGHLPNGHIIPALLAGNTIVFKSSELTPKVSEFMMSIWEESELPRGVINLVHGGRSVGEALVAASVDGVLFTGSSAVGHAIHRALGGRPEVMVALEMGGNNPLIVDEVDAVESAARTVALSAFLSAGQRCTCSRRLILVKSKRNREVVERLISLASELRIGRPDDEPAPFMGPVISTEAALRVIDAQRRLAQQGGVALLQGRLLEPGRAFLSPAIMDVTQCESVPDEEIFGPLLQVRWVDSFEQAISVANDTQYGLAAGLLSDNEDHCAQFPGLSRAGVVSINKPTAGAASALPFGGIRASGNHRPSAYYAADYCAWPQAQTLGVKMSDDALPAIKGLN